MSSRSPLRASPTHFLPIAIVPRRAPAGSGTSGSAAVPDVAAPVKTKSPATDRLSVMAPSKSDSTPAKGITAPWHPASRAGGGSALPPRGGSGNGAQAVTVSAVQGRAPLPQAPDAPTAPPTIPGVLAGGGAQGGAVTDLRGAVITRNSAAQRWNSGSGGAVANADPGGGVGGGSSPTGGFVRIPENPSSLPSSSAGNGSGFAQLSFPYFKLYISDYYSGVFLFPNQFQQATLGGPVNLFAQVSSTASSSYTYSWNTSGLTNATGITGASTANLQFSWSFTNITAAVEPLTLTVTNSSSQQESQTVYFVVPLGNVVTMPYSGSWPVTIPPDLVEPGAAVIPSQGVSADADSGALDSAIDLPSYNPNVPAIALTYNSVTADPRPIVVVHHQLDPSQAVPTAANATLTFNSSTGTTWYYNTSDWIPGDIQQIALQANATALSTGRYSYSVQTVDERSTNTTTTYSGTATVLNQSSSAFGDGWTLQGLEQITSASGGVILSPGDNGESLWFSGSPGVGGNYTSPAGEFSTLTKTSSGYTRTLTDGTQITFDSNGNQTATIDLNGLHTTFAYSSGLLSTITDPYGAITTLSYSSGKLSTIRDPDGRLTTFTFSGNNLTAVQQADSSHVTFTYDGSGRMTARQDPLSHTTSISYDSAERAGTITRADGTTELFSADQEQGWTNSGTSGSPAAATLLAEAATTYTSPNGNSFQTRPDWMGLGQLGQATDPYGDVTSNVLNSNGLPIVTVDGLNRITQYNYDSLGNPTKITYPDLTNDQYTYNSDSEPLTHTDGNSNTTSYTHDAHGNLTGIQDPLNNRTTLTYTTNGRVQSVTDANNKVTSYQYDSQDRTTTVQFPDGTTNLNSYDSQGDVTKFTDGRGNATTYSYDALDRETGSTDALNDVTTLTLDAAGNVTKVQAPTPAGQTARTTTYAYDSMNRLGTMTDPLNHQTVYAHDADGNVTSVTDPLSRITTYQYDEMDRRTVTVDPMGKSTTVTYDADGEKLTVTDPLNRTTTLTYSVRGWVSTVTDPLGNIATYTYSATGKELGQYQTQGSWSISQVNYYDSADRLVTMMDPLGNSTTIVYDGVGNRTKMTDPNGNAVTLVYDSRNRLLEVIEPLGVTVSYTYDNSGNQQTATDALGHTTTTLYDALDRATTMISAVSGITTITYDAAGRKTSLTDPVGNKTQWAYDADDRVTTVTDPNGSTVTSVYDADNELTDTTDQDGRRTTYSYDNDGRNTGESWLNGSTYHATYTYDAAGQMTGATDPSATLTMTYDNDGRVGTIVTSGPGTGQPTVTLSYGYDQLGDETSVKDSLSSQGITSLAYDAGQRVTSITQSFGGTSGPQVLDSYDNGSRLTSISRQIGSSNTATHVNTTITYDAANRVVTMTDGVSVFQGFGWNTTPLATQVYNYDNASRVTAETDAEGTASFTYDSANELTTVTGSRSESYSYDLNGNRDSTGYSTGTENETNASPGATYTYDNAGNMISSTNTSTHVTTSYTYDYRNRLTGVTTGGSVMATYIYDALNRRIGVNEGGAQTWTVYDGTSPDAHPYADFNSSGSLTMRYLFGPGVVNGAVMSVILARTSSGGTTAWYLTDKLGSARDIVDTSGNVMDHIVFDSFGNIVTETNATNGDRFKYAGMQYDSTTSQDYDHARWYGAGLGRFTSQDPMGFRAGDTNLYRYVGNEVTDLSDSSGMDAGVLSVPLVFTMTKAMLTGVGMSLASAAVVAAGFVAVGYETKLIYEATLDRWDYEARNLQLDLRIQLVMIRSLMAHQAAVMVANYVLSTKLPEGYGDLTELKQKSFLLGLGFIPAGLPPGMDPQKWKEEIDKTIKQIEDYLIRIRAPKPPTPPTGSGSA